MAKIIFFTENLPSENDPISGFSYELMRSLAESQHEVRVLTTYRQDDPLPPTVAHLEILRPFKKWSWLEVPAVMPILMQFAPDILHFIQPHGKALEGWTNAMTALPATAPFIGRPSVVTSFFDVRAQTLAAHKPLLLSSDAVTTTNASQLARLREFLEKSGHEPLTEVIPAPSLSLETSFSESSEAIVDEVLSPAIEAFFSSRSKAVFIPGDVDQLENPPAVFRLLRDFLLRFPDAGAMVGGGWGKLKSLTRHEYMAEFEEADIGGRLLFTGPLSAGAERQCLARASAVFLAGFPPDSLAITRLLREGLAAGAVLVISERQAELDSLPWEDRMHAFITTHGEAGWGPRLADALSLSESPHASSASSLRSHFQERLGEFHRRETLDHPGNLMSRLYTRLLEMKNS
jgi:hypothetical protein